MNEVPFFHTILSFLLLLFTFHLNEEVTSTIEKVVIKAHSIFDRFLMSDKMVTVNAYIFWTESWPIKVN